ncbi:tail length tape measure protein [Maritalea mobilis]|uniref:Tail length tape measure protein n=1 Tax=Maritalea mobilis TaxID=483324 RepID=A0A4R6VJK8_9HYPH|nr:phage tail length tape measure family protein [Maritalea mobilis]TDQ63565.1 tail length tape measure protein [Maritalea mobilis]
MARAVIGALRVNLGMNSAQFHRGLKNAQTGSEKFAFAAKRAFKVVAIGAAAAAAGIAVASKSFLSASIAQEKSVKQLEAVLKSTKQVAGLTSKELQKMASAMQSVTTYGDETVIEAQSLLLTFTKIGRDAFPQALEATLNVATAMGTDLKSAALQVGKALNDPVLGMTALSRSGIQFTEQQKKVVKELVETGRVAEAQKIILRELETQFGGSARAARDTMGGALTGLSNAFGDLFEVSGPGMENLRKSIENLAAKISSPEFQQAVQNFGAMLFDAIAKATEAFIAFMDQVNRFQNWVSYNSTIKPIEKKQTPQEELAAKLGAIQSGQMLPDVPNFYASFNWPTEPKSGASSISAPIEKAASGFKKAANDLAEAGRRVFEATRTPQEQFNAKMDELNKLLEAGAIDWDTYQRAVKMAQDEFDEMDGKVDSLGDKFADMFKSVGASLRGVIDGSKNWLDVLSDIMMNLAQMAFSNINFGGGFGGIIGSLFSGLFGFAKGGTIMPGGTGGIDSQLVAFRKSPNERVDITKPGQQLTSGAGNVQIDQTFVLDGAIDGQRIQQMIQQGTAQSVEAVKRALPDWQVQQQTRGAIA